MIKKIIQYPTPLSVQYATDVRHFDTTLFTLIDDLKDTMNENNLDGLSAFQIGNYFNVLVVKNSDGTYYELINPRLISHSGEIITQETTAYFPNRSAEIKRFANISIVYQDRNGKDHSLKASDDFAVLIQRKIDYTFGATFLHKMSKEQKHNFENGLGGGSDVGVGDYCPTTFKRDKILLVANISMGLMVVLLLSSFFISDKGLLGSLWDYQLFASSFVVVLELFYFFYAQYEGKLYTSCSSCQLGNIIGTTMVALVKLSFIVLISYFVIRPG